MNGAQITLLVLIILSSLVNASLDGEDRTGKYKFSVYLLSTILYNAILFWGGFWKV